jgi:hypothetical protein
MTSAERTTCPSCGGAGGGPFGPAGSAWDDDEWVCPRCEGAGVILVADAGAPPRPGLVKAANASGDAQAPKRKATG